MFVGLTCFINCASVKWATRIQDTFTFAKLLAIAILTAIGVVELARGELQIVLCNLLLCQLKK